MDGLESSGQIEKTTAAGHRASAEHASRHLAGRRIDELTGEIILDWQDKLLNEDGLCSDSVAKDHRLLKQALSYAVEIGALGRSPFTKSVRAPKRRRREPNALDDEGRRKLLGALDGMVDSEFTLGVRLGLSAGLRREEICGLRWRDVDFAEGTIRVRNAVTEANGKTYEKAPKSASSRRDVPLEPDLARRLNTTRCSLPWARRSSRGGTSSATRGGTSHRAWARSSPRSRRRSTWWGRRGRACACTTFAIPTRPSSSRAAWT